MAYVMIWDPYERLLWGIAISIAFMCGIYYIIKGRKREIFNERIILFGFAGLIICFAFVQIFAYLQELQIKGTYVNGTFYGDFNNYTPIFEVYNRCMEISFTLGFIILFLSFEMILKRTRYLLTIVMSILLVLVATLPFKLSIFIFNYFIGSISIFLFLIILYLYIKWSKLEFKAVSSFLLFGYMFILIGTVIRLGVIKKLNFYPLIIAPILFIIGCFITLFPTIINTNKISQSFTYWVIYGILALTGVFFLVIIQIFFINDLGFTILYGVIFAYSVLIYSLILRNIKSAINSESVMPTKEKFPDILESFMKAQKVTEEEVSVSKEKKVCLVCKGKLSEFNIYICPKCETFYCTKCAQALVDMENMCWACSGPIDKSKPVKPYEKEGEISDIEISRTPSKKPMP